MSHVPAIIAAEADLKRRLEQATAAPLEARTAILEALVSAYGTDLAGHSAQLSLFEGLLGAYGGRLTQAETTLGSHAERLTKIETHTVRVVTNYAELIAAMLTPGKIIVRGQISCLAGLVSTTDDLEFEGDGPNAGFLLPHNFTSQQTVMWVKALRNKFRGIKFTTGHPLTSSRSFQDIGLRLAVAVGEDCSGLEVTNCRFEGLAWGILRDGSSSVEDIYDITIEKCSFKGLYQGCIYVRWNTHDLHILNNKFEQRTATQTHDIEYNAIYVALRCDRTVVELNHIKRFGRIAIEIWNDHTDPLAADSNRDPQCNFNTIEEPLPWSTHTPIGISAFGIGTVRYFGNVIKDCVVGIELVGTHVDTARHLATQNQILRARNQAFSVNGVNGAALKDNLVERVAIDGFPGLTHDPVGIQMINGARDVKVRTNTFKDAGRFNVWVAGKALTITAITNAADALFTASSIPDPTQPNGWYVGKRICLRGIGGMTALNDRYYSITYVSGNTFRLGVDTSGMPAYTSGGRVQEDYLGLVICDNDFYVDDEIDPAWSGPSSFARSIFIHDIQQAVVQGNTRYVNNTLTGYWGTYSVINYGTVFHDFAGGSVNTTAAEVVIAGSNQTIPVFP